MMHRSSAHSHIILSGIEFSLRYAAGHCLECDGEDAGEWACLKMAFHLL